MKIHQKNCFKKIIKNFGSEKIVDGLLALFIIIKTSDGRDMLKEEKVIFKLSKMMLKSCQIVVLLKHNEKL